MTKTKRAAVVIEDEVVSSKTVVVLSRQLKVFFSGM